MKTRKSRREVGAAERYWLPLLAGTVAGFAVCLVVLLVMALVLTWQDMPLAAAGYMAVAALGAGALVGGVVAARKAGGHGLVWGAACGAILFLIPLLIGWLFFPDVSGVSVWFRLAVAVLCAAVGGVLGVNAGQRR